MRKLKFFTYLEIVITNMSKTIEQMLDFSHVTKISNSSLRGCEPVLQWDRNRNLLATLLHLVLYTSYLQSCSPKSTFMFLIKFLTQRSTKVQGLPVDFWPHVHVIKIKLVDHKSLHGTCVVITTILPAVVRNILFAALCCYHNSSQLQMNVKLLLHRGFTWPYFAYEF